MDAEDQYLNSERGFWYHRPEESFPPPAIVRPEEFRGQPRLAIACTQIGLSDAEQRRIIKQWCEALPHLKAVRYLWFESRVPQALFDAACRLPRLTGLYVKWGSIKDLSALSEPPHLRYLHLGHPARVLSLDPIPQLAQLRWLELDGIKAAADLEPLAGLQHLAGLAFTGAEFKRQAVASFAPLRSLRALSWLNLGALRADDGSLAPLAALDSLRFLSLANFFPLEEFAALSLRLPNTRCAWFAPYVSLTEAFLCTQCRRQHRVLTSGRPGRILCPHCDASKFEAHMRRWQHALAAAAG